ncbi:putative quinol monooxygenase [Conexibacter sp. CPCC 206217]|uniref:putative quinol monooxygenase n=1 Tax=Conexibacter sp. CPCC 206217 TaxID=3064574 RepID=UPI002716AF76|nr:antibiotic biosynthesis monooxygenase [Conexibacter sp. CPCC 206217]MDO8212088.1 hypothetical protein [Conexibacter sp. CPCC 206217]
MTSAHSSPTSVEEWADREALDVHFATPHFKHVAAVFDEILVEPFGATMLTQAPTSMTG